MPEHRYSTHLVWDGSTGVGYRGYPRQHRAVAPPASAEFRLSSDQAFRGDPALANPEQLLVMAASSCHLLAFLAVAARGGVDVVGYEDEAVGVMPLDGDPVRITEIRLEPVITVAAGTDPALVEKMVHQGHEECYVANSLSTSVTVTPTVVER